MRQIKNGPWCPVRIWFGPGWDPCNGEWLDRPHRWRAALDGVQVSIWRVWPGCSGRPITAQEYTYMRALTQHAQRYEPRMPEANPRQPIDWLSMRPIF